MQRDAEKNRCGAASLGILGAFAKHFNTWKIYKFRCGCKRGSPTENCWKHQAKNFTLWYLLLNFWLWYFLFLESQHSHIIAISSAAQVKPKKSFWRPAGNSAGLLRDCYSWYHCIDVDVAAPIVIVAFDGVCFMQVLWVSVRNNRYNMIQYTWLDIFASIYGAPTVHHSGWNLFCAFKLKGTLFMPWAKK